jgi:hypothetical protein
MLLLGFSSYSIMGLSKPLKASMYETTYPGSFLSGLFSLFASANCTKSQERPDHPDIAADLVCGI